MLSPQSTISQAQWCGCALCGMGYTAVIQHLDPAFYSPLIPCREQMGLKDAHILIPGNCILNNRAERMLRE